MGTMVRYPRPAELPRRLAPPERSRDDVLKLELEAMQAVAAAFGDLPEDSRRRVLAWMADVFGVATPTEPRAAAALPAAPTVEASAGADLTVDDLVEFFEEPPIDEPHTLDAADEDGLGVNENAVDLFAAAQTELELEEIPIEEAQLEELHAEQHRVEAAAAEEPPAAQPEMLAVAGAHDPIPELVAARPPSTLADQPMTALLKSLVEDLRQLAREWESGVSLAL